MGVTPGSLPPKSKAAAVSRPKSSASAPVADRTKLQNDVIRGVRWAAILLTTVLALITVARVIRSTPATAAEPPSKLLIQSPALPQNAPEPAVVPDPPRPTHVSNPDGSAKPKGSAELKAFGNAEDAQVLPAQSSASDHAAVEKSSDVLKFDRLTAPAVTASFVAPQIPANMGKIPAPVGQGSSSSGNPAVRAVRSVGRLFGFGKKHDNKSDTPAAGK